VFAEAFGAFVKRGHTLGTLPAAKNTFHTNTVHLSTAPCICFILKHASFIRIRFLPTIRIICCCLIPMQVKRCDEMARRLRFFNEQVTKAGLPMRGKGAALATSKPFSFDELEVGT
jgi:hypothetical protein